MVFPGISGYHPISKKCYLCLKTSYSIMSSIKSVVAEALRKRPSSELGNRQSAPPHGEALCSEDEEGVGKAVGRGIEEIPGSFIRLFWALLVEAEGQLSPRGIRCRNRKGQGRQSVSRVVT
jgi:hypothetical protein